MSGGIKVNENWKQQYNQELRPLFGDSDIISSIRIRLVMLTEWKVSQVFNKSSIEQVLNNNP
jgi:hypothetical protein